MAKRPGRRVALHVERSIDAGLGWTVSEPNGEPLWGAVRAQMGAFLHRLFQAGAFAGTTARDAYFVKCDAETTTQDDLDAGRLVALVGFAPLKPAEFVHIRIERLLAA